MDFIGFDKIEKRIKSLTERLRGGLDEVARELHNVFLVLTIKFRDNVGTGGARRQGKSQEAQPELNEVLYDALYEDHHIGVSTKKGNWSNGTCSHEFFLINSYLFFFNRESCLN